jgi:hypothetical protein
VEICSTGVGCTQDYNAKIVGSIPAFAARKIRLLENSVFFLPIMHPIDAFVRVAAHSMHTAPKLSAQAINLTVLPHHHRSVAVVAVVKPQAYTS